MLINLGITVKEAMTLGKLKEGKVIAGEKGLNREITYIDILEVPDIIDWLRSEELILTTGYVFKNNTSLRDTIIEEMAKHNAAGLVIKANRFLEIIPDKMIQDANKYGLPIILIPSEVPYIEITHPLLKEILIRQNKERWVNENLKEILSYGIDSIQEIKKKLKSLNSDFDTKSPMVLVLISYRNSEILNKCINMKELKNNSKVIMGEIKGNYVFICSISSYVRWKKEIEKLLFLDDIDNINPEKDLICIISKVIKNPKELQKNYKRLNDVLFMIDLLPEKKNKYYYDDIVHYFYLSNVCILEISKTFVDYVLEPFLEVNEKERDVLIETLHSYAKNGGNLTKASKSSYLHRNTFIYRMNKVKELLKEPLDSPEELFKYNLALTLHKLINKKS